MLEDLDINMVESDIDMNDNFEGDVLQQGETNEDLLNVDNVDEEILDVNNKEDNEDDLLVYEDKEDDGLTSAVETAGPSEIAAINSEDEVESEDGNEEYNIEQEDAKGLDQNENDLLEESVLDDYEEKDDNVENLGVGSTNYIDVSDNESDKSSSSQQDKEDEKPSADFKSGQKDESQANKNGEGGLRVEAVSTKTDYSNNEGFRLYVEKTEVKGVPLEAEAKGTVGDQVENETYLPVIEDPLEDNNVAGAIEIIDGNDIDRSHENENNEASDRNSNIGKRENMDDDELFIYEERTVNSPQKEQGVENETGSFGRENFLVTSERPVNFPVLISAHQKSYLAFKSKGSPEFPQYKDLPALFNRHSFINGKMETFFPVLRNAFIKQGAPFPVSQELVLDFQDLNFVLSEDNIYCTEVSFADITSLFTQLNNNTKPEEKVETMIINIKTKERFSSQFNGLLEVLNNHGGFEALKCVQQKKLKLAARKKQRREEVVFINDISDNEVLDNDHTGGLNNDDPVVIADDEVHNSISEGKKKMAEKLDNSEDNIIEGGSKAQYRTTSSEQVPASSETPLTNNETSALVTGLASTKENTEGISKDQEKNDALDGEPDQDDSSAINENAEDKNTDTSADNPLGSDGANFSQAATTADSKVAEGSETKAEEIKKRELEKVDDEEPDGKRIKI